MISLTTGAVAITQLSEEVFFECLRNLPTKTKLGLVEIVKDGPVMNLKVSFLSGDVHVGACGLMYPATPKDDNALCFTQLISSGTLYTLIDFAYSCQLL